MPPPVLVYRGEAVTHSLFEQRWRRSAAALSALGVGDGDVVALMLHNRPEAIELMMAVRHLGAQWCPVNWHYKADEVRHILQDSGARVFVAEAPLLQGLLDSSPDVLPAPVRVFTCDQADPTRPQAPGPAPTWEAERDRAEPLATPAGAPRGAMFYTSGTTGRPKGIVRAAATPQQLQRGIEVRRLSYGLARAPGDERVLLSAPLYHSAPNAYALSAVLEGATLFLEERFDAERTLALIDAHRLTHAYLVPTMFVRLLALPAAVRAKYELGSMRFVASTGSPCPPQVKHAMIEWWGPVIHESYGASELGYMTLLTSEQALRKPGSAGLPLPGVTLAILDGQGRELPRGTAGLIYVDQPAFADFSYANNAMARERMAVGRLKTMGDIGFIDEDGFLFIVDRQADMVISGGVNIYPVEIEALLHTLHGVADCAVFGIPDDEFGESLAAAVQPAPGSSLTPEAVRAYLHQRLAGFKVPKVVTLHEALPREDTGKIFKRLLREPYWAGRSRRV
ncbi:MAG: AMP-binding protein [Rubrivivax sp.]|nr:AMP-binding protein [Rubrivivax sp.]